MNLRSQIALAPTLLLVGCPEPDPPTPPPEPIALIDGASWERVTDPAVDAFADLRPADAVCDDTGWIFDPFTDAVEILTEVCDYLTLRQTTREPIVAGDTVTVLGYHDALSAPVEPALGYMGLALDGEVVWALDVPIPSDPAIIEDSFISPRDVEAGGEIQLHVHNHGPNTWEILTVTVTHAP